MILSAARPEFAPLEKPQGRRAGPALPGSDEEGWRSGRRGGADRSLRRTNPAPALEPASAGGEPLWVAHTSGRLLSGCMRPLWSAPPPARGTSLSRGERVDRRGAFTSRDGTGEGSLPSDQRSAGTDLFFRSAAFRMAHETAEAVGTNSARWCVAQTYARVAQTLPFMSASRTSCKPPSCHR